VLVSAFLCRDVGFLRYWTPEQIPNFFLVVPILTASLYGTYLFVKAQYHQLWARNPSNSGSQLRRRTVPPSSLGDLNKALWQNADVAPFFLVQAITTYVLLFASHTQIALRVSIGNPVLFWIVGALIGSGGSTSEGRWAKHGVVWGCVWGAISLALWAGFYPPA
jgi:phosphatidylinositol glycan class V